MRLIRSIFAPAALGVLSVSGLTAAAGCGEPGDAASAVAVLAPTRDHAARGIVRFEMLDPAGLRVVADLEGLTPGDHAFHVHEVGDCGAQASAAGPHFDFLVPDDASPERITGNLGELVADASGAARLETVVRRARLGGERSILGRAVVVHARGNDPEQPPDGAAGERIACGVIEATGGPDVAAVRPPAS